VSRYRFVAAEKLAAQPVTQACAALEVSRSAYYRWSQSFREGPSQRAQADAALGERIASIHAESRGTYGSPRVQRQLAREGTSCSRKRVARLMASRGLAGRFKRRFRQTTIADPTATSLAPDRLQRAFQPDAFALNRAWVGDISYLRTWEGWCYLATVIDLASRRVVGFAVAGHLRTSLICEALEMATKARRPAPGLVFHSDRGSQYTSHEFTQLLAAQGIVQSLSRPRQCWDNAVAESFFATLKTELVYRESWPTRAAARSAVFEFIEVFYNRQRLHSSLGYLSPAEYEATKIHHHTAAHAA
jgi:transposase InsO family protein